MAEGNEVDAKVRHALEVIDETVLGSSDEVARAMALLTRVHASALAVQGAATHLREVSTVAVASVGAALAQILAGETERGTAALAATKQAMADATLHLEHVISISERVTTLPIPHE